MPPGGKPRRPLLVVWHDPDRIGAFTAGSHLESWPEHGGDCCREAPPLLKWKLMWLQTTRLADQPIEVDDSCAAALDSLQPLPRNYRVAAKRYSGLRQTLGKTAVRLQSACQYSAGSAKRAGVPPVWTNTTRSPRFTRPASISPISPPKALAV